MQLCAYCGNLKEESELTKEHVIPQNIGGNLNPTNPFALKNVCKRCNNTCGTYVDGPFIKNWFTHNEKAKNALRFLNLTNDTILPLSYFGVVEGLKYENKICELWLGPTGDVIYHLHDPYPQENDISPMVGKPTYVRSNQIDPGFLFIFINSNNPAWHPAIINSVRAQFKDTVLYLANGPTPKGGLFTEIPKTLSELHVKLSELATTENSLEAIYGMDSGVRFIGKVALGMGTLFLNEDFQTSESATKLRNFMWAKTPTEREHIPVHGSGFFKGDFTELSEILNRAYCHTLMLLPVGDKLCLYASFYGTQTAVIEISSDPKHWENKISFQGLVFTILPGLQKCVGPLSVLDYINHNTGVRTHHELAELDKIIEKTSEIPPFNI
nr:HNH endonuclease [Bacillus thuringiensis]